MSEDQKAERGMERRTFMAGAAAAAAMATTGEALGQSASVDNIPIIDAHIHLFDPTTPLGPGYMGSAEYRALNKPSLPSMYSPLAKPTGIVGAIVVESAAFYDDNLFYLQTSRADPFMVGVSGSLNPASPEFGRYLTHFAKDPLYRAIRASRYFDTATSSPTESFNNPPAPNAGRGGGAGGGGGGAGRGADDGKVTLNPTCVKNLKLLADADLALDTANPSMNLMTANVKLADAIPNLRIIMDHLPSFDPTPENQKAYEAIVKEMAARPNIFVKLTEVYHPLRDGTVSMDYEPLRARLEYLYNMFGEDRVMFGTDYPNSYGVATIPQEVGLMKRFFSTKTRAQAEKYFWKNSAHIYKWIKRTDNQPNPT